MNAADIAYCEGRDRGHDVAVENVQRRLKSLLRRHRGDDLRKALLGYVRELGPAANTIDWKKELRR